jgi:hypothetical protein
VGSILLKMVETAHPEIWGFLKETWVLVAVFDAGESNQEAYIG